MWYEANFYLESSPRNKLLFQELAGGSAAIWKRMYKRSTIAAFIAGNWHNMWHLLQKYFDQASYFRLCSCADILHDVMRCRDILARIHRSICRIFDSIPPPFVWTWNIISCVWQVHITHIRYGRESFRSLARVSTRATRLQSTISPAVNGDRVSRSANLQIDIRDVCFNCFSLTIYCSH